MSPIETLVESDVPYVLQHFMSLSDSDQQLRFGGEPPSPERIRQAVVDGMRSGEAHWFGMYDPSRTRLLAVGVLWDSGENITHEKVGSLGLSTLDEIRGQRSWERVLQWVEVGAAQWAYDRVTLSFNADNLRVRHLMGRLGVRTQEALGIVHASFPVPEVQASAGALFHVQHLMVLMAFSQQAPRTCDRAKL